jgi:cbb3-type cytochrome oxidase subunit 3
MKAAALFAFLLLFIAGAAWDFRDSANRPPKNWP